MKKILIVILLSCFTISAKAFEYKQENFKINFSGILGGGALGYKTESLDASARGLYEAFFQINSELKSSRYFTLGATISERLVSNREYSSDNQYGLQDAFAYIQNNKVGRIELGRTNPVSMKLHIFVPEVSGLRMHSKSFIYKYLLYGNYANTTTAPASSYKMNRISIVSAGKDLKFGFGFAPGEKLNDYENRKINSALDFGLRYKINDFKLKPALSFGVNYLDKPCGNFGDIYSARIDADYRMEFSSGLNLSYNSFVFGISGKYIYDKNNLIGNDNNYIFAIGTSYDLLNYSFSLGYYFSEDYEEITKTLILSGRYKLDKNTETWLSVGTVEAFKNSGFIATGLRIKF